MTSLPRGVMIFTGAIGDHICASPAMRAWGERFEVTLVSNKSEVMELFLACEVVAKTEFLDAIELHTAGSGGSARLRNFLSGAQRIILWCDDEALRSAVAAMGYDVRKYRGRPYGRPEHATDYYYGRVADGPSPEPSLALSPERCDFDVIFHPRSGGLEKNWPAANFNKLASELEKRGLCVAWSSGEVEDERGIALGEGRRLPRMTLLELGRRLSGVRLYVGGDTGITHLAAAVGCPTLAIFGAASERLKWEPRGRCVETLEGRPWPPFDEVLQAALRLAGIVEPV